MVPLVTLVMLVAGGGGRCRAQRVPGLETDKRNEPSYFGLSLSVPTNERLVPLLPRPE